MYYIIYKITNTITNKIYIGAHKTTNLNDNYMGSGTAITAAIDKYGIKNFNKEILYIFDNSSDMFKKEAEIVNEEFIKRNDTYNLSLGGRGGDFEAAHKRVAELMKDEVFYNKWKTKLVSINNSSEVKSKRKLSQIEYYKTHSGTFKGKHHTQNAKNKISKANKGNPKLLGPNNGSFGTCWIHNVNTQESKKISKTELDEYLKSGYAKGRVKPKNSIWDNTIKSYVQKPKENTLVKDLEKKFCFIHRQTNKRKFFKLSELDTIDYNIWKPTWIKFNLEEINKMLDNHYSWNQIAKYYDTTYWSVYSWYRNNK